MDFSNPTAAFSIALMQTVGGLGAAIGCILILCSINDLLGVITRFVALAMIAKIDDFYTAALPEEGNKIKKTTDCQMDLKWVWSFDGRTNKKQHQKPTNKTHILC